jgi:hypothetical protein
LWHRLRVRGLRGLRGGGRGLGGQLRRLRGGGRHQRGQREEQDQ